MSIVTCKQACVPLLFYGQSWKNHMPILGLPNQYWNCQLYQVGSGNSYDSDWCAVALPLETNIINSPITMLAAIIRSNEN